MSRIERDLPLAYPEHIEPPFNSEQFSRISFLSSRAVQAYHAGLENLRVQRFFHAVINLAVQENLITEVMSNIRARSSLSVAHETLFAIQNLFWLPVSS